MAKFNLDVNYTTPNEKLYLKIWEEYYSMKWLTVEKTLFNKL
jgi:hypothetical protein